MKVVGCFLGTLHTDNAHACCAERPIILTFPTDTHSIHGTMGGGWMNGWMDAWEQNKKKTPVWLHRYMGDCREYWSVNTYVVLFGLFQQARVVRGEYVR